MSTLFNLKKRRLFKDMPPSISDDNAKKDRELNWIAAFAAGLLFGMFIENMVAQSIKPVNAQLRMSTQIGEKK